MADTQTLHRPGGVGGKEKKRSKLPGFLRRRRGSGGGGNAAPQQHPSTEKASSGSGLFGRSLRGGGGGGGLGKKGSSSKPPGVGGGAVDESPAWRLRSLVEKRGWDEVKEFLRREEEAQQQHSTEAGAAGAPATPVEEGHETSSKDGTPSKGHSGSVRQALESIVDFTGQNTLHHLCRFQPPVEIVRHVLALCPDLSLGVDCLERTPLHIAAGWGADSGVVLEVLESARGQLAASEGCGGNANGAPSPSTLRVCLERSSGKPDAHGKTPLHLAAARLASECAAAGEDPSAAEETLRVLKALADACPETVEREDAGGMTPSDLVLRGEGAAGRARNGSGGRFSRKSKKKAGAVAAIERGEEIRRRAVRYLVKARGRHARLRKRSPAAAATSGDADSSEHSSDSSVAARARTKRREQRGAAAIVSLTPSQQAEEERREDALLTAHLLELMGHSPEDYRSEDERDEASLERIRKMLAEKEEGRGRAAPPRNREGRRRRRGPGRPMTPVDTVHVPLLEEGEDDNISALTTPDNLPEADEEEEKEEELMPPGNLPEVNEEEEKEGELMPPGNQPGVNEEEEKEEELMPPGNLPGVNEEEEMEEERMPPGNLPEKEGEPMPPGNLTDANAEDKKEEELERAADSERAEEVQNVATSGAQEEGAVETTKATAQDD